MHQMSRKHGFLIWDDWFSLVLCYFPYSTKFPYYSNKLTKFCIFSQMLETNEQLFPIFCICFVQLFVYTLFSLKHLWIIVFCLECVILFNLFWSKPLSTSFNFSTLGWNFWTCSVISECQCFKVWSHSKCKPMFQNFHKSSKIQIENRVLSTGLFPFNTVYFYLLSIHVILNYIEGILY